MVKNNNREYKITDSNASSYQPHLLNRNTNYTKYPLANNPNAPLQNINYKDRLNMCNQEKNSLVGSTPFSNPWYNVVAGTLGVTAVILALSNPVTLPAAIAAGAGITAAILPIIWPQDSTGNPFFDDLMFVTSDMLNKELSQFVQVLANATLTGLRTEVNAYQRALLHWQTNQQSQAAIDEVVSRYQTTNSQFRTSMSQFTLKGYEVQLLPIYTTVANLHLLHIRDGIKYAQYWNLALSETSVFTNGDFQHRELLFYTEEYTDYCTEWYWKSLSLMEGAVNQNLGWNWIRYNEFRNMMTFTILDSVALFPTYDIRRYNQRLKIEILSRKIYSDPINFLSSGNVQQDDLKYTVLPKLFRQLAEIEFHTSGTQNSYLTYFLSGHKNTYRSTDKNSDENKIPGGLMGEQSNINLTKILPFDSYSSGFNNVGTYSLRRSVNNNPQNTIPSSIVKMNFTNIGGTVVTYDSGNQTSNLLQADSNIPKQKANAATFVPNYDHYLADMILANYDTTPGIKPIDQIKSYSFAWNHGSISFKNIVEPIKDSELQTTIFPAIKASRIDHEIDVEQGYSHTGGPILSSSVQQPFTTEKKFEVHFPFYIIDPSMRSRYYEIRVRYAANNTIRLVAKDLPHSGPNEDLLYATFNNNFTTDLRYSDFKYSTLGRGFLLTPSTDPYHLVLEINHNASHTVTTGQSIFIIDKIEFIPLTM